MLVNRKLRPYVPMFDDPPNRALRTESSPRQRPVPDTGCRGEGSCACSKQLPWQSGLRNGARNPSAKAASKHCLLVIWSSNNHSLPGSREPILL